MVRHLLDEGCLVLGVGRQNTLNRCFKPYLDSHNLKNFYLLEADINFDIKKISSKLREFEPQYVINFIAQGMVAQSWQSPADWFRTNVLSQVKLLEKIRAIPNLIRYVHVTTPEVYGSMT